ncbi:MAG TPA: hypothetical protein VE988_15180 [Gemmataceae bacterium]|nr:hypothetical protein [Gemmataceae bacterium]
MLPDEMLVYEPHHVGFARFGDRWYRIVANYGGGDLIVAPRPSHQDEVDHKFCKSGCKKLRYIRKEKWLIRKGEMPQRKDSPSVALPVAAPKPMYARLGLAVVLGIGIGVAMTAVFMRPASLPASQLFSRLPTPGSLHQDENGWWRVEDVLFKEEMATDLRAAGKYEAYLLAAKVIVPFHYTPPEEKEEKTALLVLTPAHPPLGMVTARKYAGAPPAAPTAVGQPAIAPQPNSPLTKKGPLSPPKAQWHN